MWRADQVDPDTDCSGNALRTRLSPHAEVAAPNAGCFRDITLAVMLSAIEAANGLDDKGSYGAEEKCRRNSLLRTP